MLPAVLFFQYQVAKRVLGEHQQGAQHVFGDAAIENAAGVGDHDVTVFDRVDHQCIDPGTGGVDPAHRAVIRPHFFQQVGAEIGDHQYLSVRQCGSECIRCAHFPHPGVVAEGVQARQGRFVFGQQDGDGGVGHRVSF